MNRKGSRKIFVAILLLVAMAVASVPVQAAYELRATNENYKWLWAFNNIYGSSAWASYGSSGNSYLLKYDYGIVLSTYGSGKQSVNVGTIKTIKIGDGQCVAFAKAMSNTNSISTPNWIRGNKVMDGGVLPGTIIATFNSGGQYYGHVAVFDTYHFENNVLKGINVWDQNYVYGNVVGRHRILSKTSSDVNDANSYYVVKLS
ncbi:MAG: BPSL0067 family protein [Candidatus Paceibacterota bacterium]|jgi:hypothetical protein